jgi:hypothetical protein
VVPGNSSPCCSPARRGSGGLRGSTSSRRGHECCARPGLLQVTRQPCPAGRHRSGFRCWRAERGEVSACLPPSRGWNVWLSSGVVLAALLVCGHLMARPWTCCCSMPGTTTCSHRCSTRWPLPCSTRRTSPTRFGRSFASPATYASVRRS